jgi:hypothetical protein
MLFIGYFEALDSRRGIAWRTYIPEPDQPLRSKWTDMPTGFWPALHLADPLWLATKLRRGIVRTDERFQKVKSMKWILHQPLQWAD